MTEDDFTPIPSVEGAYRAPDGRIVYTAERDRMLRPERRSAFRLFLDRMGLRKTHDQQAHHPTRDVKDGV